MAAERPAGARRSLVAPGVAAAGAFVTLLGLGTWQVERLRWKEALLATIAERAARAPEPAPAGGPPPPEYVPVFAEGVFRHDLEILLAPRTRNGVAGAHVLTPLEREGAAALLVNRGFVPAGRADPASRAAGLAAGRVRVAGVVRLPPEPGPFTPENDPAAGAWHRIDLDAIAARLGVRLAPYVLEADASPNPGGLPVGGGAGAAIRNAHLGYALTWYGLAAALAGCVTALARGGRRERPA